MNIFQFWEDRLPAGNQRFRSSVVERRRHWIISKVRANAISPCQGRDAEME
jgi:hypothetical protein